jgi:5,10-methylenetetrahydromethanopterin reductase
MTAKLALWTLGISSPVHVAAAAERAEAAGWDGLGVVDSQNLAGDSYVALALAARATTRLGLATAVTNPVTRHPATTAAAIASVQQLSGGRAALGIGRGDSALAHLGRAPLRVKPFERYLAVLQRYLRGDSIPFDELDFQERMAPPVENLGLAGTPTESRLHWLGGTAKVPVEVAATGPRVIEVAARQAERVLLSVGADVERLGWAMEHARAARRAAGLDPAALAFGAYVNLVSHPEIETARRLVSGGLATFARFAVMESGRVAGPLSDEQRKVLGDVRRAYDMRQHTVVGSPQASALTPEFIDRYAIVGPPDVCIERLREVATLGIDKVMVVGPTLGADRAEAKRAAEVLVGEVLPAFSA